MLTISLSCGLKITAQCGIQIKLKNSTMQLLFTPYYDILKIYNLFTTGSKFKKHCSRFKVLKNCSKFKVQSNGSRFKKTVPGSFYFELSFPSSLPRGEGKEKRNPNS